MFSSVKFKENGKKRIMTVPSKWIVGDNLCWPNNNNQVSTLFRQMADPKDSWKQIQITRQLYQVVLNSHHQPYQHLAPKMIVKSYSRKERE